MENFLEKNICTQYMFVFVCVCLYIYIYTHTHGCLVAQSCLTLCDPLDYSPPGSSSMEFSRQEYWCGLPFPSPGDLPNPGVEPRSPALHADSLPTEPQGKPM